MTDRSALGAGVGVTALLILACGGHVGARSRPDILLVVLDTVRADRLSAYGSSRPTGLYLEALAEASGVLFEDVTAPASWTWPSHASLFTGEPPWVHGAHMALLQGDEEVLEHERVLVTRLRADLPTLAERFSEAGYRTVALSVNRWLAPEMGLVRGFEETRILEHDPEAVSAAREVLNHRDGRPLFLFVNLMAAHAPYSLTDVPWARRHRQALAPEGAPDWLKSYLFQGDPPGVFLTRRGEHLVSGVDRFHLGKLKIPPDGLAMIRDLYDGELGLVDRWFGEILELWAEVRPNSVVVVTSDHGEQFGEHGLLEHRASVYPELTRVPLVIAAPGRLPVGLRVETPVQLQDVYPTLLDLAGIATLPGSLLPVIAGGERTGPIVAVAWPFSYWARLVGGRFKHLWHLYREGDEALVFSSGGDLELYDVAADPGMTRDLSGARSERAAALMVAAETYFGGLSDLETPAVVFPDEVRAHLAELGYVVE